MPQPLPMLSNMRRTLSKTALENAKKTLDLALKLDLPSNATIAPTVRRALAQNLALTLALKNRNTALSDTCDNQLRATLQRIANENVTSAVWSKAIARLAAKTK